MTKFITVVDEMDNFARYESTLRGLGYKTWQTSSSRNALEMVRVRTPDLLLAHLDPLDYFRTQIDGPELVRRVHTLDTRDTKVKSVLMHERADEAEVQATLDELRREGIEVRSIHFSQVPEHIGVIVQELIGV